MPDSTNGGPDRYDYLLALLAAHSAAPQSWWRLYDALLSTLEYLQVAADHDDIDTDGVNVSQLIEMSFMREPVPQAGVTVILKSDKYTGPDEDEPEGPPAPQLTEDEIKNFTAFLDGIPTAKKDEDKE
jgi:hypothetical protein